MLTLLNAWRASTVPLAVFLVLVHVVAVPWARARSAPEAVSPLNPPELGTPGLDGAEAETGMTRLGTPLPRTQTVTPPPAEAVVSPEKRAEVMETARRTQLHFEAGESGVEAVNPPQALTLRYDGEGMRFAPRVAPMSGERASWSVRMRCESVRFDGEPLAVSAGAATCQGNRASREVSAGCTEWWVNRDGGVKHGFTLAAPAEVPGRVVVTLSVATELDAVEFEGGVGFVSAGGTTRLVYEGLRVFDAGERELPSSMTLAPAEEGWHIALSAELAGAEFPVTIDPVAATQEEETLASDGAPGHEFGFASDGAAGVVAVGAPGNGGGKVYLFEEDEGGPDEWNEAASVTVPAGESPGADDRFGEAVAVFTHDDRTWLAVGAPRHAGTGGVFLYARDEGGAGSWGFVRKIDDADLGAGDAFGCAVDAQGGRLAIGAKDQGAGAVYVYEYADGTFSRSQKMTGPGGEAGDEFGAAVAMGGDHMVVGAPGEDDETGGAYLYQRGSPYLLLFRLFTEKVGIGARFGAAVAMAFTGLLLAVGAPYHDVSETGPTLVDAGSVFLYAFSAQALSWGFVTGLFGPEAGALFGFALALTFFHDLVVGAPGATSVPGTVGGAVFVYLFSELLRTYADPPDKIVPESFIDAGMALGTSVVLLGTALFVLGSAYSGDMGAMFRFTLAATLLTFALWQQLFWTEAQINDPDGPARREADPDRDGLVNELEFAMFLVPVLASALANPGRVEADARFHFAFRQSLAAAGVLLLIQYSQLLGTWFRLDQGPLAGMMRVERRHAGIRAQQLLVTVPVAVLAVLFLRLSTVHSM